MNEKEQCKICRFYIERQGCDGNCHRHAPIAMLLVTTDRYADSKTAWPEVHETEWCGDYEPRRRGGKGTDRHVKGTGRFSECSWSTQGEKTATFS